MGRPSSALWGAFRRSHPDGQVPPPMEETAAAATPPKDGGTSAAAVLGPSTPSQVPCEIRRVASSVSTSRWRMLGGSIARGTAAPE